MPLSLSIQEIFRLCQPSHTDTSLILRAKLALILSLLTGRSVSELTAPRFSQNADQNNIAIQYDHTLSAYVLSVFAGTPTLKKNQKILNFMCHGPMNYIWFYQLNSMI